MDVISQHLHFSWGFDSHKCRFTWPHVA